MNKLAVVVALSLLLSLSPAAISQSTPAPNFSKATSLIQDLRNGGDDTVSIEIGASDFQVLRTVVEAISESDAKAALAKAKSDLPTIRFTKTDELVSYEISPHSWIERTLKGGEASGGDKWFRRELRAVGTYPNSSWASFVDMAGQNGLSDFALYKYRDSTFASISFDAIGPSRVSNGSRSLMLSPSFYQVMRVSPRYKSAPGQNGFAVIIHDPHSSVAGRLQLMRGLRALFKSNQPNFEFLVEGKYPEAADATYATLPSRTIGDAGLAAKVNAMPQSFRPQLVNSMLTSYLVDTPMAFRLLNQDLRIPAYAIDDNRYLNATEVRFIGEEKEAQAMSAVLKGTAKELKSEGASQAETDQVMAKLYELAYLIRAFEAADVADASDKQLLRHQQELAEMQKTFAGIAQQIGKGVPGLAPQISVLKQVATSSANEAITYDNALKRNATMVTYIIQAASASNVRTPIAFIGSYHTQGILEGLRGSGIGYVVLEPREIGRMRTVAEEKTFQNFLENPNNYFRTVTRMNKGLAALTPEQVEQYHSPYLLKQEQRFEADNRSLMAVAKLTPQSEVDVARLTTAVGHNGSLAHVKIDFAGGGVPPPPKAPPGTFAYFENEGGKNKLVLLGTETQRWASDGRYACLEKAFFALPTDATDAKLMLRLTSQYRDENTGQLFYTFYDGSSKRQYVVERPNSDVSPLLGLATIKSQGNLNVHVSLSELIKGEIHGDQQRNAGSGGGMAN
jgi:hypothetical protein